MTHRPRGPRRGRPGAHGALVAVLLAALLSFVQPGLAPTPAHAAPPGAGVAAQCSTLSEQESSLDAQIDSLNAQVASISAQIEAHNAAYASVNPYSAAAVAAYNATADSLNAQRDALNAQGTALDGQAAGVEGRAATCTASAAAAAEALAGQPGDWAYTPSPTVIANFTERLAGVNRNLPPLPPNARGGYTFRTAPEYRPMYEQMRAYSPAPGIYPSQLAGAAPPSAGDPDPAYPDRTLPVNQAGNPDIAVDHIVPLAELLSLPGFLQLTPDNTLRVINASVNLQWMSGKANGAKSSGPLSRVTGADPDWLAEQQQLHDQTRAVLQQAIDDLLAAQQAITG